MYQEVTRTITPDQSPPFSAFVTLVIFIYICMLYVPHYQRPEANTDALPMCGGHSHLKMRAREYQSRWGLLNKMESHTCCTNWKSHEKCPEQEWEASVANVIR